LLVPKVLVFDGQVFNGRCDSGYWNESWTQEGWANWLVALICTSLATYNDFLQPSRFEVRSALTGLADLDVQLNALPTGASRIGKDVVRAMIYQRRMEKTS
jgi:hypothetical protein